MEARDEIIPGPGRGWALVRLDHWEMWCVPEEYCKVTVLPVGWEGGQDKFKGEKMKGSMPMQLESGKK